MPTIRISSELKEFLDSQSNGDSMDVTIKRLVRKLNVSHSSVTKRIVRKHIPKSRKIPAEEYYRFILRNIKLPRRELQRSLYDYLESTGLLEQYPDEKQNHLNSQNTVRWRTRFSNSLNQLKTKGIIESQESSGARWQSEGIYQLTEHGRRNLKDLMTEYRTRLLRSSVYTGTLADGYGWKEYLNSL